MMVIDPAVLSKIAEPVPHLEQAVHKLVAVLDGRYGSPQLFNVAGARRPRYTWPRAPHVRVLKAVRVVSGLYAVHSLLETGFVAESAAVFRTVDDFLEDIEFLHPGAIGLTELQKKFVEEYFDEDERPINERLQTPWKVHRVTRQKIRAALADRISTTIDEPNVHEIISIARVVDEALSGAVHGDYPSTMSLYGGPNRKQARFHMTGMEDVPPIMTSGYVAHYAIYVHRALNIVAMLSLDLGQRELFLQLQEEQIAFDESDAYQNAVNVDS